MSKTKWYETRRQPFSESTCMMCGKKFLRAHPHIYVVKFAGRHYPCCSWTCYNKAIETKERTNEQYYRDLQKEQTANKEK